MVEEQVCAPPQTVDGVAFDTKVISDIRTFHTLEREWDALLKQTGAGHPFLSHAWISSWWECFGQGKELFILTLRLGGRLVAGVPMMIHDTRMCGLKVRRLELIYNFHTPRSDFVIGGDDAAYRAIWQELSRTNRKWDVVALPQIPASSRTILHMEGLAKSDGWITGRWTAPPSPFIRLDCGYETLFRRLRDSDQYNLKKRYGKLSKIGPVDVEFVTLASSVREAMEQDGLRIEAAAWKGGAGTAMNSDPHVAEFYIRLAERSARNASFCLAFLRAGGKRIAVDYLLQYGRTLYSVKIGYDPEFHSYSPGNVLLNLILQEACKRRFVEYDFLGTDDAWKCDWTSNVRPHEWLFLFRDTVQGRFLHQMKFKLLPKVKNCVRPVPGH